MKTPCNDVTCNPTFQSTVRVYKFVFMLIGTFVLLTYVYLGVGPHVSVRRISTRILTHLQDTIFTNGGEATQKSLPHKLVTPTNLYDVYGNALNATGNNNTRQSTCTSCMPHTFGYIIKNDTLCKQHARDQVITLLVLVMTTHTNRQSRDAIRDTWLSVARGNTGNVRYAFLLGETTNLTLNKAILEESKQFGDILKEGFMDSYQNLTYKTMMAMKWAATRCTAAEFLMKTDDDMFVNIPALLDMTTKKKDVLQKSMIGSCQMVAKPIRDATSKWHASVRSYPNTIYPGFCSGTGYVMSINVARKVYEVSPNVPFFHLEDVYVALCARILGFNLVNVEGFNVGRPPLDPCLYKSPSLITSHHLSASMLMDVWTKPCLKKT